MDQKALVDTSFLYALADSSDRAHPAAVNLLDETELALWVPTVVIPEAAYLIGARLGYDALRQFVRWSAGPLIRLEEITQADLLRVEAIMTQYADARFDFVDTAIMALAERLDIRTVFTFDQRDFRVFRLQHCEHLAIEP